MSGERLHLPHDLAHHGELSANVVGFCRFLRAQGAGSGPGEEKDCLLALEHIDLYFDRLRKYEAGNKLAFYDGRVA